MSKIKKSLTFGTKIKTARKSVGLSQKDLAAKLNLTNKAISSYEVGRAQPPIDTLREISRVTEKPVSYFINEYESDESTLAEKIHKIEQELQSATKGLLEIKKLMEKKGK